jgi:hypothetical protein
MIGKVPFGARFGFIVHQKTLMDQKVSCHRGYPLKFPNFFWEFPLSSRGAKSFDFPEVTSRQIDWFSPVYERVVHSTYYQSFAAC